MRFERRRIRVLDLRDTHEIGGPGKTILETFKTVDASRFDLRLGMYVSNGTPPDTPFIRAARQCDMPVHFIHGHQLDPRLVYRHAGLVRRERIDIVHAHELSSNLLTYLASFLHRVPIVTTVHGWIGNSARQRALSALDRRLIPRFDRVLVVSRRMREALLREGASPATVRLVHNGLVLANYRRTGRRGELTALAGRAIPGPVVASIGRLSREKGHADLIEATAILAAEHQRVSLVLAGDGPERQALETLAHERGVSDRVYFLGYVDRPQLVLEETDLMVLPSHSEGLPNAALEALAMDVPVLATAVGGTPEVITDGETGRLVPSGSPAALAREMLHFLQHREAWRTMAERGRHVVEREFDFAARTRTIETIYEDLMAGVRS